METYLILIENHKITFTVPNKVGHHNTQDVYKGTKRQRIRAE